MDSELRIHELTRIVMYLYNARYVLTAKRDTTRRNRTCIYSLECETEVRCEIEIGRVIFIAIGISNVYRGSNALARKDKRKRECGEPR